MCVQTRQNRTAWNGILFVTRRVLLLNSKERERKIQTSKNVDAAYFEMYLYSGLQLLYLYICKARPNAIYACSSMLSADAKPPKWGCERHACIVSVTSVCSYRVPCICICICICLSSNMAIFAFVGALWIYSPIECNCERLTCIVSVRTASLLSTISASSC